jgi:hypothetical protein
MTFFIFALSQNSARRNDVFNGFPFSSANPTFIAMLFLNKKYNKTIACKAKNILFKKLKLRQNG